ncbi:MAG: chemotaxis protein CheA [Paracoccaceae bacterium]
MSGPSLPVQTFMQEANEVLEGLEKRLLELEDDPENGALVDAVFRNLHTLKGSGEMFGFSALARFTHGFENAYDAVRSGKATVSPRLIDVSLRSRDHIQRLIDAGADPEENARLAEAPEGKALLAEIADLLGAPSPSAAGSTPMAAPNLVPQRYRFAFRPEHTAFRFGMRPDLLIEEMAALGEADVAISADAVPLLDSLDPVDCHLRWHGRLETDAPPDRVHEVFLFAEDGTFTLEPETSEAEPAAQSSEGTPAATIGDPAPTEPARAPKSTDLSSENGRMSHEPEPSNSSSRGSGVMTKSSESVRVQAHRLDEMMDQLGELVIAQARLNRIANGLGDPTLVTTAEEMERLITGLRDATLSIRMLPIGTVFGKFRRVVRDLSSELGKQVQLVTEGEDTELDKNVIDNLSEPLVHIIRNSVDHGIEPLDARRAAGKSDIATVSMIARQAGGEVLVTVSDDGGGLRTDRIRARAIERGLISADNELSEKQINQLIFAPGFSTAQSLSSVSGRGVGMDAVRTVIADLGGSVEVESQPGLGTDITLRLPLTLAIIEGLLVRIASTAYVLPLATVDECVDLTRTKMRNGSGQSIMTIRDELVPFVDLRSLFELPLANPNDRRRIVIVRAQGRRIGLVVDEILGQHQTVIKSLSVYHRDIPGLAGGTILGDGSVALILDPVALIKNMSHKLTEAA